MAIMNPHQVHRVAVLSRVEDRIPLYRRDFLDIMEAQCQKEH